MKLCVLTTHPVQYIAPWFAALGADSAFELRVLFLREPDAEQQGAGFGRPFTWDIPLREGYDSRILEISKGVRGIPEIVARLPGALGESRPDAVLITGWNEPALIAAYPIVRACGVPIVVRGESNVLRSRGLIPRLAHRLILAHAAAALTIGRSNREFYLQAGMSEGQLFDGAYFVDSERLAAMADEKRVERTALREAAGFGTDDFVFGFVGKHVAFKRPGWILEAAASVRASGVPVKVLLAGTGALTEELKARAADLRVPTHFTGFLNQSELWRAYTAADALVLPSDSGETWGLVVNEAMLFGLPVIVGNEVGCGPDLVQDRGTGVVFTGGPVELGRCMEQLATGGEAAKMGRRGRDLVLEQYSMPRATAGLKAALAAVTGRQVS